MKAYLAVAEHYALPLAPLALAWVYSHPAVTATVIGATNLDQLRDNVMALNLAPLSKEVLASFEDAHLLHLDPTKGKHAMMDLNHDYDDPSKAPWGSKDSDIDPELDQLISQRLQ